MECKKGRMYKRWNVKKVECTKGRMCKQEDYTEERMNQRKVECAKGRIQGGMNNLFLMEKKKLCKIFLFLEILKQRRSLFIW